MKGKILFLPPLPTHQTTKPPWLYLKHSAAKLNDGFTNQWSQKERDVGVPVKLALHLQQQGEMNFASDWGGLEGRLELARFISMLVLVCNSSRALSLIFFIHGIGREETDCTAVVLFHFLSSNTHERMDGRTKWMRDTMKWQQQAPYAMTIYGQGRLGALKHEKVCCVHIGGGWRECVFLLLFVRTHTHREPSFFFVMMKKKVVGFPIFCFYFPSRQRKTLARDSRQTENKRAKKVLP